ncbi:MAG TPA: DUF2267 domain-containing protein [Caldilineaceae bacterium]|nr:DUF2267 domain-containing protein [Caldilineaceae bacterium]
MRFSGWAEGFGCDEHVRTMQYDDFVRRVQEEAGLETSEEALRLTEAVLATLGERLYRSEQSDLAAQLPRGIKEFLVAKQPPETTRGDVQRFSLEEFYNRVGARTGLRYARAVEQTQAVMAVLQEAVTPGEIEDILQELPAEYQKLFERNG